MPLYILLSTLSTQGVQTLQANPDRLREVNRDIEELGARVLHQWATLGEFDFVNVVEAPDTAPAAKISASLGARGSPRIETLPALAIDDLVPALNEELRRRRGSGGRSPPRGRRSQRSGRGCPAASRR